MRTFLQELQDDVRKRLDTERKKRAEEEDKALSAYKPLEPPICPPRAG